MPAAALLMNSLRVLIPVSFGRAVIYMPPASAARLQRSGGIMAPWVNTGNECGAYENLEEVTGAAR
jgi:hypothetical protein